MSKTAFITGVAGQDGAYLAKLLVEKEYEVHGLVRWDSHMDPLDGMARLDALNLIDDDITLHFGDITDAGALGVLIREICPNEIYNLAGLSQVAVSFDTPGSTLDINVKGTLNVLQSVRASGFKNETRIYQASSSEMFGNTAAPQNETTPMIPNSPYGTSKLAAYHLVRVYREAYGMFASNGILFNHESALRGEDFVTRKITKAVAEIELGRTEPLVLGNIDSVRDWGDARDYVRGMWMMLQADKPDDYVLATGKAYKVRDFVERAFGHIGISVKWQGQGVDEVGVDQKTGRIVVKVDPALFRPNEVDYLLGDAAKAKKGLGWIPTIKFDDLVSEMVNTDRAGLRNESARSWSQTG